MAKKKGLFSKFINGDKNQGLRVDWDLIRKEYKKLKCPADSYNPLYNNMDDDGIIVTMSPRAYGKTTGWLLVSLLLYKHYGLQTTYLRQVKSDVEPKHIKNLFEVILEWGYLEKIFGPDSWNHISYRGQRWTLEHILEDGTIDKKDTNFCMYCDSIDRSDRIKSTLNLPDCVLIIYDEFIATDYLYNEFVRLADIVKTIFRDRVNGNLILLANTIDRNSQYFDELDVRDDIETMEDGEYREITSDLGTKISIEIIAINQTAKRVAVNKRFFGFKNSKLASITGSATWAMDSYQHIPRDEDEEHPTESIFNRLYIKHCGKLIKLHLVYNKQLGGAVVYVTPATRTYSDSIILTLDEIYEPNHYYGLGPKEFPIIKKVWILYSYGRFYYARNSEGSLLKAYIKSVTNDMRANYR